MMAPTADNDRVVNGNKPSEAIKRGTKRKRIQYPMKSIVKKLCRVCGDRAERRFFGVLSCQQCKDFYRKSVIRAKVYKCLADGACPISFTTAANNCKKCLFEKCEKVGMSYLSVKLSQKSAVRHLPVSTPDIITKLNRAYTQLFSTHDKRMSVSKIKPLLLSDIPLEKSVASYKASMFSQLCTHYERFVGSIVQFSRLVPGFMDLHPDDQLILIKTGFIGIWSILNASRLSQVQDSVTMSDGTQIPICEVTTVFTKEYVTSLMDLSDECRTLRLLPSDKAILMALCLVCPDRPNLIDKDKVADLQATYMTSMKQYCMDTRPSKPSFSKSLTSFLSNINDIGKQHGLLLNIYRTDVGKLTLTPVITELFDLHTPSAYKET